MAAANRVRDRVKRCVVGGEEMRTCTSRAPAERSIFTILREVVPRMMESSTSTTFLPSKRSRIALSLTRTPKWRIDWVGWMKVRPM